MGLKVSALGDFGSISMKYRLMVNPFRKSLVTGISKPNRLGLTAPMGIDPEDDRIPIGPTDVISMHRGCVLITKSPKVISHEPGMNTRNVIIVCILKDDPNVTLSR